MMTQDQAKIDQMKDLVAFIARSIVEAPEAVTVTGGVEADGVVLRLEVAPQDKGRVIGKQGRVAQAMRTILRVVGSRAHTRVELEII